MKKVLLYFSLFLLIILKIKILSAQKKDYEIKLKFTTYLPEKNVCFFGVKNKKELQNTLIDGYFHLVIQFTEIPTQNLKNQLMVQDIFLDRNLYKTCYLGRIHKKNLNSKLRKYGIRSLSVLPPEAKYNPEILSSKFIKKNTILLNILTFEDINLTSVKTHSNIRFKTIREINRNNQFQIECYPKDLPELAKIPWIIWIEPSVKFEIFSE